ncbi:unnamed protein product [Lymnaea stagnalis]|uniref:Uncharacterized protein n=1 Tax=Lymnaea stagnalis TaxID=6523 RepID=A0AAV2H8P9_LYMST
MAAMEGIKKDANPKVTTIPGLSYIPDKLEITENPALMLKIEAEFLDFVVCLTDILKLLHLIKPKHLRSLNPIPHSVIREVRVFGSKGPLYKKYDKHTSGAIAGISASADNLFKRGMSQASGMVSKTKPVLKKEGFRKKPLESDLVEITGKKTKPLWHSVALDRPPDPLLLSLLEERVENVLDEGANIKIQRDIINKKNIPVTRTKSETMVIAIKYLMQTPVRTKDGRFQDQMDMMAAADAGFKSVEAYKIYLDTLRPHWYKDLLKDSIQTGTFSSKEVLLAFEELGHFYYMDENSLVLAKAKLCYLVMSLPIWDIGRLQVQRVVDFILYNILKEPRQKNILEEWLSMRKLPYVVHPPIRSDDLLAMNEVSDLKIQPILQTQQESTSEQGRSSQMIKDQESLHELVQRKEFLLKAGAKKGSIQKAKPKKMGQ